MILDDIKKKGVHFLRKCHQNVQYYDGKKIPKTVQKMTYLRCSKKFNQKIISKFFNPATGLSYVANILSNIENP